MTNLDLTAWPSADRFGAGAEHLHALGAISLTYNRLEYNMSYVFDFVLRDHTDIADGIWDRLTNRHRMDVLRLMIPRRPYPEPLASRLAHAALCFDLCTDNRNTLAHVIHEHQAQPDDILLARKKNSNKTRENFYELPLAVLRRVADEMRLTNAFVTGISTFMLGKWLESHEPRPGEEFIREVIHRDGPPPLPDIPPQPDKLTPRQLDQA